MMCLWDDSVDSGHFKSSDMTFITFCVTDSILNLRLPEQVKRSNSEFTESLVIGRPPSPTGETGGRDKR